MPRSDSFTRKIFLTERQSSRSKSIEKGKKTEVKGGLFY